MSLSVGLVLAAELAFLSAMPIMAVVHPRFKCWHAVHDISRGA